MRILMVQTFHYYRGGDSTYMLNLTKLLEERGHEVIPFAMHHPRNLPSPYSRYFVSGIDYPELLGDLSIRSAWKVLARSIHSRESRQKIARLVDDVRPDIAHFHNFQAHITTSIISPLRRRGVPIVWTLHDYGLICPNSTFLSGDEICERCLPARFFEAAVRRCKKGSLGASLVAMLSAYYERLMRVPSRVDRFVTPSRFLGGKLVEAGFDRARIRWIPNFVELEDRVAGGEGDYFLYFGRLSHEKGVDLLIRAVKGIGAGRLLIVGTGPVEGELEELASGSAGIRIEFTGYRTGPELEKLLAGAKFVVLPSRWYENLPFSIMEAMAAAKPVVAARIGGIPEMVEDGVNGLLFPPGDVDSLGGCLRRLLEDDSMRREMGRRGREKAERIYNRDLHYRKVMEVYGEVLGRPVELASDGAGSPPEHPPGTA